MIYYINGVIIVLLLWLTIGAWRLRRRRVTPGAAAAGMLEQMLTNDRRAAIEIIVDAKTAYRDPEHADGNVPSLARGAHVGRAGATQSVPAASVARSRGRRPANKKTERGPSFRRGIAFGILAWAAVCGLGALVAVSWFPAPSYVASAALFNVTLGGVGATLVYWRELRPARRQVL